MDGAWPEERPGFAAMAESARTPGFRQVLVALDGSEPSASVLPDAVALAQNAGGSVVLAQALPPGSPESVVSATRDRLGRLTAAIEAAGVAAATVVLEGDAAEQIVSYVTGNGINAVALGSHGAWDADSGLHGSVADAIIRQSPVPTLVRRTAADPTASSAVRFRRLLVPLDGSRLAERALPDALALANMTGGRVLLVQAVGALRGFRDGGSAALIARELRAAGEYLTAVREHSRYTSVPVDVTVRLGRPAETILWVAQETGADLVVMATHGRSGLRRERLGSVALAVLQGSVPLLLLRSSVTAASEAGRSPAKSAPSRDLAEVPAVQFAPAPLLRTSNERNRIA